MSSLRPLLTISFLAMVGLFLYMKINETEPVIPEGAAEWDLSTDIQIGGDDVVVDTGSGNAPASSYSSTATAPASPYGSAPAYSASTMNEAPPAFQPIATSTAPAFTPGTSSSDPISTEVEIEVPAESPADASTNADPAAGMASMPELPSLPPAAAEPSENALSQVAAEPAAEEEIAAQQSDPYSAQQVSAAPPFVATPDATVVTSPAVAETKPTPGTESVSAAINLGSRYGSASAAETTPAISEFEEHSPITPTENFPAATQEAATQPSLFASARLNVQAALDRGQLSQALLLLSDWYGDPSLSADESAEVETLLSQLAGSVIYSTESRLEPPYLVQQGETLTDIAQKHNVPPQLLAKINGIADPSQLQPGQQLKVVRGPFAARIHLEQRKLILMLDRRYAGEFNLDFDPSVTVEEGYWTVSQKLLTPADAGSKSDDRIVLLTSTTPGITQVAVLRASEPRVGSGEDPNRVLKLSMRDVADVFDILSLGSQVVIRR